MSDGQTGSAPAEPSGDQAERFTLLDGCELSYELTGTGTGPLLVLVHGLGGSRALWRDLRPQLAGDHRLLIVDLRGAGETREAVPAELSLDVWAADLRELLQGLALERPVLVGHSLGAGVALAYTLAHPDDVEALVLMSTDANLSNLAPRMERTIGLIEEHGFDRWVSEHWVRNLPLSARSIERDAKTLEAYRTMLLANDPDDYVRTCRAIASAVDLTERLPEIRQRALVLVGVADDRTPLGHGVALAEGLPNASVVELPGVGHTPPLEAPDDVEAAIRRFLEER